MIYLSFPAVSTYFRDAQTMAEDDLHILPLSPRRVAVASPIIALHDDLQDKDAASHHTVSDRVIEQGNC